MKRRFLCLNSSSSSSLSSYFKILGTDQIDQLSSDVGPEFSAPRAWFHLVRLSWSAVQLIFFLTQQWTWTICNCGSRRFVRFFHSDRESSFERKGMWVCQLFSNQDKILNLDYSEAVHFYIVKGELIMIHKLPHPPPHTIPLKIICIIRLVLEYQGLQLTINCNKNKVKRYIECQGSQPQIWVTG